MQVAHDAPKRPALRYYGGKWRLASWIISFFPPHQNYVEPCGGAASVLLQKPRSSLETYNDLDGNVVNFFRVLRDRPDELIHKIRLTPWARAEYGGHYEPAMNGVEKARRFWVGCTMAIGNTPFTSSGMAIDTDSDKLPGRPNALTQTSQKHLEEAAQRLIGVQIENKPYQEILTMYRLFSRTWQRHLDHHKPPGDYEVCRRPLCRLSWWLERWLWYGGEVDNGPLTLGAGGVEKRRKQ